MFDLTFCFSQFCFVFFDFFAFASLCVEFQTFQSVLVIDFIDFVLFELVFSLADTIDISLFDSCQCVFVLLVQSFDFF